MHVAVDAIGESVFGPQRAAVAAFTLGLLVTFLAVRINTRLIRAKVSWWFHDIESDTGLHVHHMVFGVVIMVVVGLALIATLPSGVWLQLCALAFGAGVALTLDEFALILRLQDVYWRQEGRLSVDAVIVAACAGLLFVLGFNPIADLSGTSGAQIAVIVPLIVLVDFAPCVICFFKGKLWTGFFGLFIPFVAIVGAVRIARPGSPWARRRYPNKPRKLAKSQRREDHVDRTWRAWREAFFDLLAGKPHLPSLAAVGGHAEPAAAAPQAEATAGGAEAGDAAKPATVEVAAEVAAEIPAALPVPAVGAAAVTAKPEVGPAVPSGDPVRKAG